MLARMDIKQVASMGGKARAAKLSKSRLSEIGRDAARSRWKVIKMKDDIPITETKIQVVGCHLCGSDGYRKGWLEGKIVWFCRRCFKA